MVKALLCGRQQGADVMYKEQMVPKNLKPINTHLIDIDIALDC